ncbi:hypothetical protein OH76DRAFT_555172 [Lentinus brumalis]|uniref:Uncharacterized protein n=1 Tax=Lentinus brumalis TaxID=2498619 RepID=A0A371D988_9APHY|nr:hypothetical protein OH76DRAFT_555172 [Polyporus brumalis]
MDSASATCFSHCRQPRSPPRPPYRTLTRTFKIAKVCRHTLGRHLLYHVRHPSPVYHSQSRPLHPRQVYVSCSVNRPSTTVASSDDLTSCAASAVHRALPCQIFVSTHSSSVGCIPAQRARLDKRQNHGLSVVVAARPLSNTFLTFKNLAIFTALVAHGPVSRRCGEAVHGQGLLDAHVYTAQGAYEVRYPCHDMRAHRERAKDVRMISEQYT